MCAACDVGERKERLVVSTPMVADHRASDTSGAERVERAPVGMVERWAAGLEREALDAS